MLHLDFSQVGGTIDKLEENFNFYLGMRLDGFINAYQEYYSEETQKKVKGTDYAGGKLGLIQEEAQMKGYPLYLIIDEYLDTNSLASLTSTSFSHSMVILSE